MKIGKKITYFFLSLPTLLVLASCDMESLGSNLGESIESKLIPNIWAFLVQLLALIVLLLVVFFFGYKPVKKFLDARKELLNNQVKDTKEQNDAAHANLKESEKRLANTRKEAGEIIDKAIVDASHKGQEIISKAEREAIEIKEKANKEIERAKEEAKKELHNEIVDVAFDASSKILSREVTKNDNSKIVDQFVKDLNEEKSK